LNVFCGNSATNASQKLELVKFKFACNWQFGNHVRYQALKKTWIKNMHSFRRKMNKDQVKLLRLI